ncbi:vegetative cell wall protein gp1-like [Nymphaea colorata]|uniref:vegetative cell wall protein gp1-like n=1 Tax=Nymphaea colorata TaxID=210225 RepID=UPI00129E6E85|nr:vegetative cell wall protein gp1-like [Nymphaea colorata]
MAVTRLLVPVVLIMLEIFVGVTIARPSFGVPLSAFPSNSTPSPALPSVSPAPSPLSALDIIVTPGFLPDAPEGSPVPTSPSPLSTIPTQLITTPPPATSQQSSSLSTSDSFHELMFIDAPEESPAPTSPSPLSTIPTQFVISSPPTTSHPLYPSPSAAADKFPSSTSSHSFFSMPAASDTFPEISIMPDAPEESPASSGPSPLSISRHAHIIDSEPSAAGQLPSGRLRIAAAGSALVAVAAIVLF